MTSPSSHPLENSTIPAIVMTIMLTPHVRISTPNNAATLSLPDHCASTALPFTNSVPFLPGESTPAKFCWSPLFYTAPLFSSQDLSRSQISLESALRQESDDRKKLSGEEAGAVADNAAIVLARRACLNWREAPFAPHTIVDARESFLGSRRVGGRRASVLVAVLKMFAVASIAAAAASSTPKVFEVILDRSPLEATDDACIHNEEFLLIAVAWARWSWLP